MLHKMCNFASFDPKFWWTVSQINKVHLPFSHCVVLCDLIECWVGWLCASCQHIHNSYVTSSGLRNGQYYKTSSEGPWETTCNSMNCTPLYTPLCSSIKHYKSLYSTIHSYTALSSTIQYDISLYNTIHHYTALYSTIHLYTVQYTPIQHYAPLNNTLHPYTALYTPVQHYNPYIALCTPVKPYTLIYITVHPCTALYNPI